MGSVRRVQLESNDRLDATLRERIRVMEGGLLVCLLSRLGGVADATLCSSLNQLPTPLVAR